MQSAAPTRPKSKLLDDDVAGWVKKQVAVLENDDEKGTATKAV